MASVSTIMSSQSNSDKMMKYYRENKALQTDLDKMIMIRNKLQNIINNDLHQGAQILLFGSSVCGFGAKDCDADMTLWFPRNCGQAGNRKDQERAYDKLSKLYLHLRGLGPSSIISLELEDRTLVPPTAAVPVLKCVHKRHGTSIDISVDMIGGVVTSYLEKLFSEYDERVAPLGLIVKQWAKCRGICDPRQGSLNSISWVFMVISYLQVGCRPPVLPVIGPRSQAHGLKLDTLDIADLEKYLTVRGHKLRNPLFFPNSETHQNRMNLHELLTGFFAYYAPFDFANKIIRVGTPVTGMTSSGYMTIEEPIQGHNTAASVRDPSVLKRIRTELRRGQDLLRDSKRYWEEIMSSW